MSDNVVTLTTEDPSVVNKEALGAALGTVFNNFGDHGYLKLLLWARDETPSIGSGPGDSKRVMEILWRYSLAEKDDAGNFWIHQGVKEAVASLPLKDFNPQVLSEAT